MHCYKGLSHQLLPGFIFFFKLFLSLFLCLPSPWDTVLGASEGSGWMILMKIFLTALQEHILPQPCIDRHSGHRDPRASTKKDSRMIVVIVRLSCAPCQHQRCSPMVFSIRDVHWGTPAVIPTNLLVGNTLEEKPPHTPRSQGSKLIPALPFSFQQQPALCGCSHPLAQ